MVNTTKPRDSPQNSRHQRQFLCLCSREYNTESGMLKHFGIELANGTMLGDVFMRHDVPALAHSVVLPLSPSLARFKRMHTRMQFAMHSINRGSINPLRGH